MKHEFEPSVDPWELMVEHNQRIQRLEQAVKQLNINVSEIVKAVNNFNDIQEVNRRTIERMLENQQQAMSLIAQIMQSSSSSAMGQH